MSRPKTLTKQILLPSVAVLSAARASASNETEALYGQPFTPIKSEGQFVLGELSPLIANKDLPASKGYIRRSQLSDDNGQANYRISALKAPVFTRANIKAPIKMVLSFNSQILGQVKGEFIQLGRGQYVHQKHLSPIGEYETDFVTIAERFMGLPYIWGGNSAVGMDCSGLVMLAFNGCGKALPA